MVTQSVKGGAQGSCLYGAYRLLSQAAAELRWESGLGLVPSQAEYGPGNEPGGGWAAELDSLAACPLLPTSSWGLQKSTGLISR